jgi:predicted metal-dependent hydrolase
LKEAKVNKAEEVNRKYKLWIYTIRRSNRAKRLRLNITVKDGLVVVLPKGFNEKEIPAILESQANWITAGLVKVQITKALFRPTSINLPAIEETWNVRYLPISRKQLTVHENENFSLVVSGESEDPYNMSEALNSWMRQKAQEAFIPWVNRISQEYALPFNKVTIRRQKTRWGSCSSQKSLNLNQNLLFIPAPLVRYVMVHELTHTKHHNHSSAFWKHLNTLLPDSKRLQKETVGSYSRVPHWAWQR